MQPEGLSVLLVKRTAEPLKDHWALPGSYVAESETIQIALDRTLEDKAGLTPDDIQYLEQLYTFDWIGKDPRGHAVTITYVALTNAFVPDNSPNHEPTKWFAVADLPVLAFDHTAFIDLACKRLRSKLHYTNIAFGLLPPTFTLAQLQQVYEAVLGVGLDKRNFRKQIIATGMLAETVKMTEGVSHRPARLYRFKQDKLTEIQQFLS